MRLFGNGVKNILTLSKKFMFIAVLLIFALLGVRSVHAEAWFLPSSSTLQQSVTDIDEDGSSAREVMPYFDVSTMAGALSCLSLGQLCPGTSVAARSYYYQRSVLGQGTQFMAYLYQQPPASTSEYLAYTFSKAGLVPKTYAQGVTYSRLLPILPIWKAARDISYIILTLVMVMIGFMIMFRAKVNPQTVASVENTIPAIIVTLILITLSFPIASLILDLMYVMIAAGIGIIGTAVGDPNVNQAVRDFTTGGFLTLVGRTLAPALEFGKIGGGGTTQLGLQGAGAIVGIAIFGPFGALIPLILNVLSGATVAVQTGDVGAGILTAVSPLLVLLIGIVLLFAVFRIFFMLLANYIQIIIYIVFAPFILLAGAIPGKNTFTGWWKSILGNALSFVVTAIMLYLGWAIASQIQSQQFWTAPFMVQGLGVPQIAIGLIALGIVLMIPQWVQTVKQMLGVKAFAQVGPQMVLAPLTGAIGQGMGLTQQLSALQNVTGEGGFVKKGFDRLKSLGGK